MMLLKKGFLVTYSPTYVVTAGSLHNENLRLMFMEFHNSMYADNYAGRHYANSHLEVHGRDPCIKHVPMPVVSIKKMIRLDGCLNSPRTRRISSVIPSLALSTLENSCLLSFLGLELCRIFCSRTQYARPTGN